MLPARLDQTTPRSSVDGELAWPVGGRHVGRRDNQLHRQNPLPWSAAYPLRSLGSLMDGVDGMQIPQMFEYACHEG